MYDYSFDGSGRDYLIRNSEYGDTFKFQIFDITSRGTDPTQIALVSEITGTPANSCGRGCGGTLIGRAHKGWWSQETGYFYSAAGEPGFRSTLAQIWDLKDPKQPKFVGRMWIPGQKDGEPGFEGQYAHHPNVDEQNKRVYIGYREAGQTAAFDISNPARPTLVWSVDFNPPHRGPHTVSPIVYDRVPNFGADALPRTYAFVVDEAGAADDLAPCKGVRSKSYMLDITDEKRPFPVSVWQVPADEFCNKGGRFGPHQNAETVNGRINRFEDKLAWLAYFNAGVRVVDLSDPYNLREVGSYVPKITEKSHPIEKGQVAAIQINDVDLDDRGLAYASDRTGAGLFILQYTGTIGRQGTVAPVDERGSVMTRISAVAAATIALLTVGGFAQAPQQKGGGDITGPYEVVTGWPQNWCGAGYQIGSTSGIWAESPDQGDHFRPRLSPGARGRRGSGADAQRLRLRSLAEGSSAPSAVGSHRQFRRSQRTA